MARSQTTDSKSEERSEQHDVWKVREDSDLSRQPSNQRHFLKQDRERNDEQFESGSNKRTKLTVRMVDL